MHLENQVELNTYGSLNEYDVVELVRFYRNQQEFQQGESFETIAATGSNAAIVHYAPQNDNSSAILNKNDLLLLDSGFHYLDGTTDVTRTICYNNDLDENHEGYHGACPTPYQKQMYTQVLQGQINIQRQIFPENKSGNYFDILARQKLYNSLKDYGHGTGHGIGHFSIVHEYPAGIGSSYTAKYREGIITSIEPGYYEAEHFGIRHENDVLVLKHQNYWA